MARKATPLDPQVVCLRCGHIWQQRNATPPKYCPADDCRSSAWNKVLRNSPVLKKTAGLCERCSRVGSPGCPDCPQKQHKVRNLDSVPTLTPEET